jgi:heterodisulfide reductase subunit B
MESHLYFPGCSLRTVAKDFDASAKGSAERLGIPLKEMKDWLCCGAVFNLSDNLMAQSGPNRILARASTEGNTLVTLCAGCHQVLKRTSLQANREPAKQEKINTFNEESFTGQVKVLHLLELLRDQVGYEAIRKKIKTPLQGLPVGAYYGCLLLRPYREMRFDDPHQPTIIEDLLECIGCTPIIYPSRTECCGSYLSAPFPEIVTEMSGRIVQSAQMKGAKAITVSCPLCKYNLELYQKLSATTNKLPVIYFTQLLGLALGLNAEEVQLDAAHEQAIRNLQEPIRVKER